MPEAHIVTIESHRWAKCRNCEAVSPVGMLPQFEAYLVGYLMQHTGWIRSETGLFCSRRCADRWDLEHVDEFLRGC